MKLPSGITRAVNEDRRERLTAIAVPLMSASVALTLVLASPAFASSSAGLLLSSSSSSSSPVQIVPQKTRSRRRKGTATASSVQQLLTFDEFPVDDVITNQYEPDGVLFSGASAEQVPEIVEDNADPTSPILAGSESFLGPIHAKFVVPTTTTPTTVSNLSLDVGYIDEPGSTKVVIDTTTGPEEILPEEVGINSVETSAPNITGFSVEEVEEDPNGFGIDNLAFTGPEAPPPPAPPAPPSQICSKYLEIDSRGSGETAGVLSPPAEEFYTALEGQLGYSHAVGIKSNPYSAVGVFSLTHFSQDLNGLGALIHSSWIGAYKASVDKGKKDLNAIIKSQVDACSATKLILIGYSQGAQITGDVFQKLSLTVQKHIAAVVLFGDPEYNHEDKAVDQDQPPDRSRNGSLGTRPKFLTTSGTMVLSYCQIYDPVCQWRLPLWAYDKYKLSQHKEYWGDNDSPADQAATVVAELVTK